MSPRGLTGFVYRCYPASFRRDFGAQWCEVAAWHRRNLAGETFGRLRYAAGLLRDAARSLPVAYAVAMTDRARGVRRGTPDALPMNGHQPSGWDGLSHDARHAARSLRRSPLFTLAAVASLAMGIGAGTAIFSVVNAVLLEPLPYEDPARLTIVWNEFPAAGLARLPLSGPEVQLLREEPDLFQSVGGIWATSRSVVRDGRPETVSAALVTPNLFAVLGVRPHMGRSYNAEASSAPVPTGVLISDELWRTHYPGATELSGQTVQLEGGTQPILGVLPPGFEVLFPPDGGIPERIDLFLPLPWDLSVLTPAQHYIRVIGRLAEGVDLFSAQQRVASVAQRAKEIYTQLASTGDQFTLLPLHADAVRNARPALLALLGAVGLLLLLASANVASLMLARTTTRAREMALRASFGASRRRLVQLLLMEGVLLTLAGALAGVAAGHYAARVLWTLRPVGVARIDAVPMDHRVILFAVGAAILAGTVFALAPLLSMSTLRPANALGDRTGSASPQQHRSRALFMSAEVAMGLTILVGATLLMQTLTKLKQADLGYEPSGLVSFKVALGERRFPTDAERAGLAAELERRIGALPGVQSVGAGSHLPLKTWANWAEPAAPDGVPESERESFYVDHRAVTRRYFETIGARIAAGRGFAESDNGESDAVAVVDQAYAARAFAGQDPIGRRVLASQYRNGAFTPTWVTIVGVIDDIRDRSPSLPSSGQVYLPFAQSPRWELTYAVRSDRALDQLVGDIRRGVGLAHGDLAAAEIMVMDALVDGALAPTRFVVLLGLIFSCLALGIAAIGLYSVVAYNTAQRVREFGLRVALGADRRDIMRNVLGYGVRLSIIGILAGIPAALMTTRLLRSLLYGVQPHDPLTLAAVAVLFVGVAAVASLGPALHATRIDPIRAMQ
jgi:putative ABC transport system permease protein